MKVTGVIGKITIAVAAVALCALCMAAKHPVQRPCKNHGTVVWTINLQDGSSTAVQIGEAAHGGRFTDTASAVWDLQTMTVISGGGLSVFENGEQVSWVFGNGPYQVNFTGGTGRFENVTGGFNFEFRGEPKVTPGPGPGFVTWEASYTGEGTITY